MSKMESYKGRTQAAPACAVPEPKPVDKTVDPKRAPLFNNENDRKAFQSNISTICNVFKYRNDLRANFGDNGTKVLETAFTIMKDQMEKADTDNWVEATAEQKSKVKEAINFLWQIVMDRPINDMIKDMALELGVLAFNWNNVFGKRPDIGEQARTIERLVTMHYMSLDLINITKRLQEKSEKLMSIAPPAYELSDHWLKTLDEELDKREQKQ